MNIFSRIQIPTLLASGFLSSHLHPLRMWVGWAGSIVFPDSFNCDYCGKVRWYSSIRSHILVCKGQLQIPPTPPHLTPRKREASVSWAGTLSKVRSQLFWVMDSLENLMKTDGFLPRKKKEKRNTITKIHKKFYWPLENYAQTHKEFYKSLENYAQTQIHKLLPEK